MITIFFKLFLISNLFCKIFCSDLSLGGGPRESKIYEEQKKQQENNRNEITVVNISGNFELLEHFHKRHIFKAHEKLNEFYNTKPNEWFVTVKLMNLKIDIGNASYSSVDQLPEELNNLKNFLRLILSDNIAVPLSLFYFTWCCGDPSFYDQIKIDKRRIVISDAIYLFNLNFKFNGTNYDIYWEWAPKLRSYFETTHCSCKIL